MYQVWYLILSHIFVFQIPKHKPVIIDLHEDSSDESDGEPPYKQSRISGETQSGSFIGSLDSFLKAARKSVEVLINWALSRK